MKGVCGGCCVWCMWFLIYNVGCGGIVALVVLEWSLGCWLLWSLHVGGRIFDVVDMCDLGLLVLLFDIDDN